MLPAYAKETEAFRLKWARSLFASNDAWFECSGSLKAGGESET